MSNAHRASFGTALLFQYSPMCKQTLSFSFWFQLSQSGRLAKRIDMNRFHLDHSLSVNTARSLANSGALPYKPITRNFPPPAQASCLALSYLRVHSCVPACFRWRRATSPSKMTGRSRRKHNIILLYPSKGHILGRTRGHGPSFSSASTPPSSWSANDDR
jgi:hypothetical protein